MRSIFLVVALAVVGTNASPAGAGPYENGLKETPGKRMPVGTWTCSMGSYAAKPCTVAEREGRFF